LNISWRSGADVAISLMSFLEWQEASITDEGNADNRKSSFTSELALNNAEARQR